MSGKRKRTASPSPGPSSLPMLDEQKGAKRRKGTSICNEKVKVVWELADGSRQVKRRLGKDKTLVDALYKISKKLDISTPGSIRLSQVREGGHEVEIYDEFDYKAFKSRASAQASTTDPILTIKVYPGLLHRDTPLSPFSGPSSLPNLHLPPYQGPSSVGAGSPLARTGSRKGKERVVAGTDAVSGPSSIAKSSLNPLGRRGKVSDRRDSPSKSRSPRVPVATPIRDVKGKTKKPSTPIVLLPLPPTVETDAVDARGPLTPSSAPTVTAHALRLAKSYRPAIPSPLGRPHVDLEATNTIAPTSSDPRRTSKSHPNTKVKKRQLKKARKSGVWSGKNKEAGEMGAEGLAAEVNIVQKPETSPETAKLNTISIASPYNLYNKPAEPLHTGEGASSTFVSPKKNGKKARQPSPDASAPSIASLPVQLPSSTSINVEPSHLVDTPSIAETSNDASSRRTGTASTTRTKPSIVARTTESIGSLDAGSTTIASNRMDLETSINVEAEEPVSTTTPLRAQSTTNNAGPAKKTQRKVSAGKPTDTATIAQSIMAQYRAKKAAEAAQRSAAGDAKPETPPMEQSPKIVGPTSDPGIEAVNDSHPPEENAASPDGGSLPEQIPQDPSTDLAEAISGAESNAVKDSEHQPKKDAVIPSERQDVNPDDATHFDEPIVSASATPLADQVASPTDLEIHTAIDPSPEKTSPQSSPVAVTDHQEESIPLSQSVHTDKPTSDARQESLSGDQNDQEEPSIAQEKTGAPDDHEAPIEQSAKPPSARKKTKTASSPVANGWWTAGDLGGPRTGPIDDRPIAVILANRSACLICGVTPTHLQKDCPEVKKGVESLETLLVSRQAQADYEKKILEERAAAKKPKKGKKARLEEEEEDGNLGMAEESVEIIENWITLLKKREAMRRRIEGKPSSPPRDTTTPIPAATPIGNGPSIASPQNALGLADPSPPETLSSPAASARSQILASENTVNGSCTTPTTSPAATARPADTREISTVHTLHQKALDRAKRRPRKAGSLSGLSASEAVIETGSSDSESESPASSVRVLPSVGQSSDVSDTESESSTSSKSGSDSEAGSEADAEVESDADGDVRMVEIDEDLPVPAEDDNSQDGEDNDSDEPNSSSESETATESTRRSTSPSSSSSMSNEDAGMSFMRIMQKPLNAKEKKQARLSAASMAPSQSLEMISEPEESDVGDIEEEDDEEQVAAPAFASQRRRGSDSSIDMGPGEEEEEDRTEAMSDILPPSMTQPPEVLAEDEDVDPHTDAEDAPMDPPQSPKSPTTSKRLSRSFVDIDREAGTSPEVDNYQGAIALEEAIEDEEMPLVPNGASSDPALEKRPQHVISQGLPSPVSSHEDEMVVATQLAEEITPKPRRGAARPSAQTQREPSAQAESQPTQPTPTPLQPRRSSRTAKSTTTSPVNSTVPLANGHQESNGVRRRLRSTSREIPDSQATFRQREVGSQGPPSPSAAPASSRSRRVSGTRSVSQASSHALPPIEESSPIEIPADQGTPTASRKIYPDLPSSQVDQLESSQSVPAVGHAEEEEPYTPSLRRSTRTSHSPLFMTQPSQPLATQRYTLVDSSLINGKATSPIPEEDGESVDADDDDAGESNQSSSGSEDEDDTSSIPLIRPIAAARRSASQGAAISMPTLSSLDTSILRNGRSAHRPSMAASQPTPNSKMLMNESESESSSSDEEEVKPAARTRRYATGRASSGRTRPKTNGVMKGW